MVVNKSEQPIPKFGLYGDSNLNRDPGFVHIEDIAARSRERDWVIKPHRHGGMFQILCLFGGRMEVRIDSHRYQMTGYWVITLPPGVIHGFRFQPNTEGAVLTMAESLLSNEHGHNSQHYFDELVRTPLRIKFAKMDALWDQLVQYLGIINRELQGAETDRTLMLEWQVKMLLITLKRQLNQQQLQAAIGDANSQRLNGFRALLEENYRNHWTVQQYATALHSSVSSLNRLCHDMVGCTAKNLIQERLLVEAKRLLIYTSMPLDQAAFSLGFKDPAYFSRSFKGLAGASPSEYRKRNNYQTHTVQ